MDHLCTGMDHLSIIVAGDDGSNNTRANHEDCNAIGNDDVLMEILSKLPMKPLMRFKCVSKSWLHMASTLIQSKPKNPVSGFFICTPESVQYLPTLEDDDSIDRSFKDDHNPLGFLPSHPHTEIIDCSDGFLLCSSNSNQNDYFLCNPITRQCVSLPPAPIRTCPDGGRVVMHVGLIFDDSSDVYRVIRFSCGWDLFHEQDNLDYMNFWEGLLTGPPHDLCIDIYSSETRQWEVSKGSTGIGLNCLSSSVPFVIFDRAIYFLCESKYGSSIFKFDVEEERCDFEGLGLESSTILRSRESRFGVCKGRLCYAHDDWSGQMEVWEFVDEEGWVLKHAFEVGYFGHGRFDILAFHPNLPALFVMTGDVFGRYYGFGWYDFEAGKFDRIESSSLPTAADPGKLKVYPFSQCHLHRRL